MKFKKDYFIQASIELGKSIKEYLQDSQHNYIIIEDKDNVIRWSKDDSPVIYGDKEEAEERINVWKEYDCVFGELEYNVMTEWEFLCKFNNDFLYQTMFSNM